MEDHGERSPLFKLLGFLSPFRMVIIMQDLVNYRHTKLGLKLNEEQAIIAAKKLAQIHAAFWNDTEFLEPRFTESQAYRIFFNIAPFWYAKYPPKEKVENRLDMHQIKVKTFAEPTVRDSFFNLSGLLSHSVQNVLSVTAEIISLGIVPKSYDYPRRLSCRKYVFPESRGSK
jgi:hypothetical protein